jgi:small subunit ribosomal protein S2
MYYVTNRWLGGTLTNWETIRQSIRKLEQLEEQDASGQLDERFTKKEAIQVRKSIAKMEENLSGIKKMPGLPQVVFVIDAKKEAIAVREAARCGIPCIAIVDTNCDPDVVPIPIPGNDDAIRAVGLFCSIISDAVMDGRMKADKVMADEPREHKQRRHEDKTRSQVQLGNESEAPEPTDFAPPPIIDEKDDPEDERER